jgi:hypothetical protein
VTVIESLRKNASFLATGFGSLVLVLVVLRLSQGEPVFQPQSDLGVLIGAVLITAFLVFKDMRESKGKKNP